MIRICTVDVFAGDYCFSVFPICDRPISRFRFLFFSIMILNSNADGATGLRTPVSRVKLYIVWIVLFFSTFVCILVQGKVRMLHWSFPFWGELEFVKLVQGKSDHQHDLTLLTSSNGPHVVMRETRRSFFWHHRYYLLTNLTNSTQQNRKLDCQQQDTPW